MRSFTVEYRPTKRDKDRPWVILMGAHPKPVSVARVATEQEARDGARHLTLTIAANRAASLMDGYGSDEKP